ncbi:MAG: hypothetical protein AAF503_15780 [Pseudomonadota bacterium]
MWKPGLAALVCVTLCACGYDGPLVEEPVAEDDVWHGIGPTDPAEIDPALGMDDIDGPGPETSVDNPGIELEGPLESAYENKLEKE